jgi:hypothetical protein
MYQRPLPTALTFCSSRPRSDRSSSKTCANKWEPHGRDAIYSSAYYGCDAVVPTCWPPTRTPRYATRTGQSWPFRHGRRTSPGRPFPIPGQGTPSTILPDGHAAPPNSSARLRPKVVRPSYDGLICARQRDYSSWLCFSTRMLTETKHQGSDRQGIKGKGGVRSRCCDSRIASEAQIYHATTCESCPAPPCPASALPLPCPLPLPYPTCQPTKLGSLL